jgi:hypothetical protein
MSRGIPLTVLLASFALAGLPARTRAADKPTPPPLAPPRLGVTATLSSPDLVVTLGPGNPFPNSFTVKNQGNKEAGLSVLKVKASLVPLDPDPPSDCPPSLPRAMCDALSGFRVPSGALLPPERLRALCGEPFGEIVEAVPALKPGESKTFTRDTSKFANVSLRLFPTLGSPRGTYIRKGVTTLVCAFDIVAEADASKDVNEIQEANNRTTSRVYREIRME